MAEGSLEDFGSALAGLRDFEEEVAVEEVVDEVEVAEDVIEEQAVEEEVVAETESEEEAAEEDEPIVESVIIPQEVAIEEEKPEAPAKTKLVKKYKDEYSAALNKYINETDDYDVATFNKLYNADFKNSSPEELIGAEIRMNEGYADFTKGEIEELIEIELEKYNLNSDYEDEVRRGKLQLKRDASLAKSRLETASNSFREKYKADLEEEVTYQDEEPVRQTPEQIQAERDAKTAQYSKVFDPYIQNGVMKIQDKDGVINVPVKNKAAIIDAAVDTMGFMQRVAVNADGTPNLAKFARLVAFAEDMASYDSTLIKYGRTLGVEKASSIVSNDKPLSGRKSKDTSNSTPDEDPEGFMQAMAKAAGGRQF
jgi:hypothetical protein